MERLARTLSIPLACLTALAVAVTAQAGTGWHGKVAPSLLRDANPGDREFFVYLAEQADFSGLDTDQPRTEKAREVHAALTSVADRTQPPVLRALTAVGAEVKSYWVVNAIFVRGGAEAMQLAAERTDVAFIYGNPKGRAGEDAVLRTPAGGQPASRWIQWNLYLIHAPEVWAQGVTGDGVVVANVDTGVEWSHPALQDKYRGWNGVAADHNYNWHDPLGTCMEPCDPLGHGTATMGVIVGDDGADYQIGVAPGARWIAASLPESAGADLQIEDLQWMLAPTDLNGENPDPSRSPDIINYSWGCASPECLDDPLILHPVIVNLRAAGIVVAAAAGNEGPACGTIRFPPVIYDEVFTVGAVSPEDSVEEWSSRGPVVVDGSYRLKPDVTAPSSVCSSMPGGGYGLLSGTSSAAPHVAGLFALVLDAVPALNGRVDLLESVAASSAIPRTADQDCGFVPGTQIPNNTNGWGRIDAYSAYLRAMYPSDAPEDGPAPPSGTIRVSPNPFGRKTLISFCLKEKATVTVEVYDASGRLVRTLLCADKREPGPHAVTWNGLDGHGEPLPTGTYFVQVATPTAGWSERVVLRR